MSIRGTPAPQVYAPSLYWEERAQRFAAERDGLAAVCSYGMPEFYNRAIQLEQRLALGAWTRVGTGTRVLDLGCGVGRWSRLLGAKGADVTGVDLSPTMIGQARSRAEAEGLTDRCQFHVGDITDMDLSGQYDLILGVTVLQHILDPLRLRRAISAVSGLLAPGGRLVFLEAAPDADVSRCDSSVFKARHRQIYLDLFRDCDLQLKALTGVDPAALRTRLLPYVRKLPRKMAVSLLALATGFSLPVNALFGRRAAGRSWHAVFVLERAGKRGRNGG